MLIVNFNGYLRKKANFAIESYCKYMGDNSRMKIKGIGTTVPLLFSLNTI